MGQYSHVQTGTGNSTAAMAAAASRPGSRGVVGGGGGGGAGGGGRGRRLRMVDVTLMSMRAEVATIAFWRDVIAECLASLLHVLLGCLATLTCPGPREPTAHTLLVALCFGLTVASLVQGFQHISGAHLNPVVSLVQVVTCKVTPLRAFLYALAQTGGAVAGASILHGITTGSCQSELGATVLHYGLSPWQGLGIEILLTFLLVFTVCATQDPNRTDMNNKALVIGFAVAGCHLAAYRFTGSSMNPARSLGPAFVSNNWDNHWIYWAGPFLGGLAAGLLYEFIFDPSRTRSRSQASANLDAEDGLLTTTSLTTANPAHSSSSPRHYYNSGPGTNALNTTNNANTSAAAAVASANNNANSSNNLLLGSPRSFRRDNLLMGGSNANAPTAFSAVSNTANSTSTPNHYVPGTYGERALIDIRDRPSNDVLTLQAPPVPRRNDVTATARRGVGVGGGGGGEPALQYCTRRHNLEDVTPGRENQAYTFDSHPRRLQSPCANTSPQQRNVMNLFEDGRETICLNDVRVY